MPTDDPRATHIRALADLMAPQAMDEIERLLARRLYAEALDELAMAATYEVCRG